MQAAELAGWSIRHVAEQAGMPAQSLHNAMNGHDVGVSRGMRLALALDVPMDWLFDDSKGWAELPKRPFWLRPGIDPIVKLAARRQFEAELAAGPPAGKVEGTGGPRRIGPALPASTGQSRKPTEKRRKRSASGG